MHSNPGTPVVAHNKDFRAVSLMDLTGSIGLPVVQASLTSRL